MFLKQKEDFRSSRKNEGENEPVLKVYKVQNSDAREVAKSLNAMMEGVVINEDGRNGYLHIKATPRQHREVESWIRLMDGGGLKTVSVIPLGQLDTQYAIDLIDNLFLSDGNKAPSVQPDFTGSNLVVRGTTDQITQIKLLFFTISGSNPTSKKRWKNPSDSDWRSGS